ncbi:GNAT family N-acetyltransferase [Nocardia otitidiscaviarum]|uniref:GNAT family N-acetyltransferase n=1 Tax=Nocardia otitidiscaviarum TaxID=1823 RepID=A0A516NPU9_9NOCA|nr:GNAT family N-acetyltransferase [Nocardia otitidiscaviarum]MCP9623776.1 GNAT family N-acetyltransferase [Nocardia otitidiscaviarum]QDP80931.1 GNAT family N-acetyltransferase [Nocardia otitidiscaviarum]
MKRWQVLPLGAEHVHSLAECHIACWREAYANLVPAQVLDAFDVDRRAEQLEKQRLRYPGRTVVAVAGDAVIGFGSGGPSLDDAAPTPHEINAMYVRAAWYGTGLAHDLMRAVLAPDVDTSLWVFKENPRARAFYRKYGFALDGGRRVEAFSPALEVRMVRHAAALPHHS